MSYKVLGRFIGRILFLEALLMVPALLISLFNSENAAVKGFLITIGIIINHTTIIL